MAAGISSPTTPSGMPPFVTACGARNLSPMDSSYHSSSCCQSLATSSSQSTSPSSSAPDTPTGSNVSAVGATTISLPTPTPASNTNYSTYTPTPAASCTATAANIVSANLVNPTMQPITVGANVVPQLYQRPSTLHGLKHKLQTAVGSPVVCGPPSGAGPMGVKTLHGAAGVSTLPPNRRKSVGHIPLSPLARTPSPSPLPSSPTRSPSPLAFPLVGHQPGASNTTQSYSPGTSLPAAVQTVAGVGSNKKSGFTRTKSSEPSSPLLRRALSPDRLHPRSAETKCTLISPLCCSPPIKGSTQQQQAQQSQQIVTTLTATATATTTTTTSNITTSQTGRLWRATPTIPMLKDVQVIQESKISIGKDNEESQSATTSTTTNIALTGPGEMLPRIAEEKDSPTSTHGDEDDDDEDDDDNKEKNKNKILNELRSGEFDNENVQIGHVAKMQKMDKPIRKHSTVNDN